MISLFLLGPIIGNRKTFWMCRLLTQFIYGYSAYLVYKPMGTGAGSLCISRWPEVGGKEARESRITLSLGGLHAMNFLPAGTG